jgi:hypothetical protein
MRCGIFGERAAEREWRRSRRAVAVTQRWAWAICCSVALALSPEKRLCSREWRFDSTRIHCSIVFTRCSGVTWRSALACPHFVVPRSPTPRRSSTPQNSVAAASGRVSVDDHPPLGDFIRQDVDGRRLVGKTRKVGFDGSGVLWDGLATRGTLEIVRDRQQRLGGLALRAHDASRKQRPAEDPDHAQRAQGGVCAG